MVSIDEIWEGLTADSRRSVCDTLASYTGSDVGTRFNALVELAHANQVETRPATQMVTNGKRKRDDSDVALPPSKKPKLAEATASLLSDADFACLRSRRSPSFGQSTPSSAGATASSSVAPLSPATPSTTGRDNTTNPLGNPASSKATTVGLFGRPISAKPETPANPPSDCDEQFTFADRRSSSAQPYNGPGTTHGNRPSAQNTQSRQAPAASSTAPPQGNPGSTPVSTVSKPPFTGVDMSSLKVPANSKVNLTLNVFQGPSSLHQKVTSPAPKKLKCIQCKAFYVETQNTAMECRRHTGRCLDVEDEKFYYQDVPNGAYRVWDCCRRTARSQGCCPCNHYAG